MKFGALEIFVGPENMAPYLVEAWVAEEDTFLVLSADPEVQAIEEKPEQIMAEASATHPAKPGSVIVKNGYPLQLLAIVHDLNQKPTWKEEWIVKALLTIFREADKRRLQSLALPLLGTLHGDLEKDHFLFLLCKTLERNPPAYLRRLWLVTPVGTSSEILRLLKAELER